MESVKLFKWMGFPSVFFIIKEAGMPCGTVVYIGEDPLRRVI
jgi:hypothetical protein